MESGMNFKRKKTPLQPHGSWHKPVPQTPTHLPIQFSVHLLIYPFNKGSTEDLEAANILEDS